MALIQAERPHKIEFNKAQIEIYSTVVPLVDRHLTERADKGDIVTRVDEARDVAPVIAGLGRNIVSTLQNSNETSAVSLLYGTIPQLQKIYGQAVFMPDIAQRLHAVVIGGTQEQTIANTAILSGYDPTIITSPYLLVHDELIDKAAALGVVVNVRQQARGSAAPNLVSKLEQVSGSQFSENEDLYNQLIAGMEETGVIAAVAFYKNQPFLNRLREKVSRTSSEWAQLQATFIDPKSVMVYGHDLWIMGEGMDTAFRGADLYNHLDPELKANPQLGALLKPLPNSRVRFAATINGIIALRPRQGEAFKDLIYTQFNRQVGAYARFVSVK